MEAARAPARDDALAAQRYLGKVSGGGHYYKADLASDPEFMTNLKILFNVNNDYAGSWFIYDPWARDWFKCPFLKQYRQFVMGDDEPGYWLSEAEFLDGNSFEAAKDFFKTFDESDRIECLPTYEKMKP